MSERSPARLVRFLRAAQLAIDVVVLVVAFVLAYALRFDFHFPEGAAAALRTQLPVVVLVELAALLVSGVYRFVWRYVGLPELRAFLRAGLGATAILLLSRFLPDGQWRVPRSVAVINLLVAFGGAFALRVLRRLLHERAVAKGSGVGRPFRHRQRVLLVGAGEAGLLASRQLVAHRELALDVIGFVDDAADKQGTVIQGIPVAGTTADLPRLVRRLQIDQVVLTLGTLPPEEIRRVAALCESSPARVRILPALPELLDGTVTVNRIRDVEIEDLLGRAPVKLDDESVRTLIGGRSVVVTGAGGSIGSELCRQIVRYAPKELLLVERNEGALFEIHRELAAIPDAPPLVPLVADVSDEPRIAAILGAHRPALILHAAAHKHVPLMESNPVEAVKNNVLGTARLAKAAAAAGVSTFVLVSTDKAVNPTSVMGATKRLAELVCQAEGARSSGTKFLAVRFGNVIGSAGSVVPIFREQIRKGRPVTITHPDMVRYFMTIPEASQLVLQASALGRGGEIFVLDMGKPVRIFDLARDLIALSGLRPEIDVPIVVTGIRPGEKLFEELSADGPLDPTRHPKVLVGRLPLPEAAAIDGALERLRQSCRSEDGGATRTELFSAIGVQPSA